MADGVELLADRWFPDQPGGDRAPILLTRLPYGRGGIDSQIARLYAERGYQVVVVSCRGTFGSGGSWVPWRYEQADGLDVLEWLAVQPWFSGRVGLYGASYHAYTQWAVAAHLPAWVVSMAPAIKSPKIGRFAFPSPGLLALESIISWMYGLEHQQLGLLAKCRALLRARRRTRAAHAALPLTTADVAAVGRRVDWFQDILAHPDPDETWWDEINFGRDLATGPPVSMVTGWYDLFVTDQLADYQALRAAGRHARLTVGPWAHTSPGLIAEFIRDTLAWSTQHLAGSEGSTTDGSCVRVFIMGSGRWVSLPEWPPPAKYVRWHLHATAVLSPAPAATGQPPRWYRYDPTDPTPSVGGNSLVTGHNGAKDNRRLEARPDVLTYTTHALAADVTVIGQIRVVLYVRSTLDHTDFFVRLCDVAPGGRSTNVCDGIVRLAPQDIDRQSDDSFAVSIRMSPTANTFVRGHRIRLQVSGGAHPLYARNPGSGEAPAIATTLEAVEHHVLHGPEHASRIELPVVDLGGRSSVVSAIEHGVM
ncbi:CocE/NonD family hydrolase [Amycolatopsis sp. cmx-11-12]|uniref:CocE/NonD family hydrolase n=1 Tax=Amycolatopsis sp. cmx-11-12 TaxID=2785795 RepID=UPI0039185B2C